MTERKSDLYRRQSEDAKRDILMGWPLWQYHNAGNPRRPGTGPFGHLNKDDPSEHLKYAVEVVLDVARQYVPRGKAPHTPQGHDCDVCDSMRRVVEWLATGRVPPVDMTSH